MQNTSADMVGLPDGTVRVFLKNETTGQTATIICSSYEAAAQARRDWEGMGTVKAYTMQQYKERLARCPTDSEGKE